MENAKLECAKLVTQWAALKAQRPTEMDFKFAGYPNINGNSFGIVFARWDDAISRLIQKTKPTTTEDAQVADAVLTRTFRELGNLVSAAQGNGIAWLLTTQFLQFVAEAQMFMSQYVNRRINLRKELFKFAQTRLNDQLLNVEKADPIASKVLELYSKISEEAQTLDDVKETATKDVEVITDLRTQAEEEIKRLKASWDANDQNVIGFSSEVTEAKESIDLQKKELTRFLSEAQETLKLVSQQKEDSDSKIKNGTELINQVTEKLNRALQDINRQALAGAFTDQVVKIKTERFVWMTLFILMIAYLAFTGYSVSNIYDPKALFDWHNLLKGLPLVAPLIWMGWFSARQVGILSRIQQDYAYKAASAVAFEGYKKEITSAKDDELTKQLLTTCVRNFGENPIRLYGKTDEPVMPMDQLLSRIKEDRTWQRMTELLGALKPNGK